jgi:hypothetical protein
LNIVHNEIQFLSFGLTVDAPCKYDGDHCPD